MKTSVVGAAQKFAMLELKIVLSTLLRRFVFEIRPGSKEPRPSFQLVLKPIDGIRLVVSLRTAPANSRETQS